MLRLACLLAVAAACSSTHGAAPDASPDSAPDAPPDAAPQAVTFSYTPGWSGVVSIDVVGQFGLSTDWTAPLVTLHDDGSGTWTGTAEVPPGSYPYLFHIVGDSAAGGKAATYPRYAIDPGDPAYVACPSGSPSYSTMVANPCSQLAVPAGAAPTLYHVRGTVHVSGAPAASYLVVLERMEMSSHHYFAQRVTTGIDGTYDIAAAPGTYRLQIQHPQYESMTDAQLAPGTLGVLRRQLSSGFAFSTADLAMTTVEMAFASYASFAPTPSAAMPMPTTFAFGTTIATKLDVYGTGAEIGDPWYSGTATTTGTASFDGNFNTGKQATPTVQTGTKYMWGIEQVHPKDSNNMVWTGQSMVFPITWN
jgi:hypothetical protein